MLGELEEVARELGYRVRYEKGDFAGGDCRVRENKILVVNKFVPIEAKISTIARTLARLGSGSVFITPQVRKLLDEESDRLTSVVNSAAGQMRGTEAEQKQV